MADFRTTHRPYYVDMTDTYDDGLSGWEEDRAAISEWVHSELASNLSITDPAVWRTDNVFLQSSPVLQEFKSRFARFNSWLSRIMFMRDEVDKIIWFAVMTSINNSRVSSTIGNNNRPHTDSTAAPATSQVIEFDYSNLCRFIIPLDNYENEQKSTVWWDLKDRDQYAIGSREHINAIRAKMVDNLSVIPRLCWVAEEFMDDFEIVSVQKLRGPALLNTALPHQPYGSIDDPDVRMALTIKPTRPDVAFATVFGENYRRRPTYGPSVGTIATEL